MPRGDTIDAAMQARIAASPYTLTVNYPPARPAATGSAPGAAPASPLTGPAPTAVVYPTAPTPGRPPVTMPCLWLDLQNSVMSDLRRDLREYESVGWWQEAEIVARVRVSDAALDATNPAAGTVFDGCQDVVSQGRTYTVLGSRPIAASFRLPVTLYVWLRGNIKQ